MVTRNPFDLPVSGILLALDLGDRRVGVATCDSSRRVALAKGIWPRPWAELKHMISDSKCAAVVLGNPLNMDGSVGPRATASASLADLIEKELGLPVLLWDERLTSRQMESAFFEQRTGRQTRASKKAVKQQNLDSVAASLILQSALALIGAPR